MKKFRIEMECKDFKPTVQANMVIDVRAGDAGEAEDFLRNVIDMDYFYACNYTITEVK